MSLIYAKKYKGFDEESQKWATEAAEYLNIHGEFNFYDVYDFVAISEAAFDVIKKKIFNDNTSEYVTECPDFKGRTFRYSEVTGQYNERQDMVECAANLLVDERIVLNHSRIVEILNVDEAAFNQFKDYFLNPMENVEIPMEGKDKRIFTSSWDELEPVSGFRNFTEEELEAYRTNFSFDMQDLKLVQAYFQREERDPNVSELKMIDTYWSDHCRHTTFLTEIENVTFEEGLYSEVIEQAYHDYLETREFVYGEHKKPMSLMDLGTINARLSRKKGELDDEDKSDEVNACTVNVVVNVDDIEQDYLLYFKNETHNHPTEIEPFGGASTCIGGGIRDPLSGRSFPYQGLRLTGSKSPLTAYEDTIPGKRSSRQICQVAMEGFSDYANQIGINAGVAKEFYHPGFEAKRLELGAVVAVAAKEDVKREQPVVGDKILLMGGSTGRDGLGAAVGSSKIQTDESLEKAGTDVQKGNPSAERKIIRVFNNPKASRLIKKSNDFGAGGVAVAIGELADGLSIYLDRVPVKYEGMHPGEIALSESQERMAVVIAPEDVEEFLTYCHAEDVQVAVVADVTESRRIEMYYDGEKVIDISREFLDTNGGRKFQDVTVVPTEQSIAQPVEHDLVALLSEVENASQQALIDNFDATIYSGNVLYPLGGKYKLTPQLGMVHKIPVHLFGGLKTDDASVMTYGYDPYLAVKSPYYGGYHAIMNSVLKAVALGVDASTIRLTVQEYFESLKGNPERWGKPLEALLGAYTAMRQVNLPSIGGKDSMSGSFEDIDVPPSVVSFAVGMTQVDRVVSREFKQLGSDILLISLPLLEDGKVDNQRLFDVFKLIHEALLGEQILAISTLSPQGGALDLFEMAAGNHIGFEVNEDALNDLFTENQLGFLIETTNVEFFEGYAQLIGRTAEDVKIGQASYELEQLIATWQAPLNSVYGLMPLVDYVQCQPQQQPQVVESTKRVVIPVLLGASGEYDLRKEFTLRNCEVEEVIIHTSTKEAYDQSLATLVEAVHRSDILAFPNGATLGDEPQMEGKFEELVIRDTRIQEAITDLLGRNGKILGIGSGFKGLILSGLIEHGQVAAQTDIQIAPFPRMKYWGTVLTACGREGTVLEGQRYFAPISSRYGIIRCDEKYITNGQVLSTYDQFIENELAIDAMCDPSGQIIGVNSLIDRYDEDACININKAGRPMIIDVLLKEEQ